MLARILIFVLLGLRVVAAQPRAAIGQPLPDANLPLGQVVIRVVAGEPSKPVPNIVVTLAIAGGKTTTMTTDASGRAQFAGVVAKSRATVSVASTAPDLARSTFVVPDAGGIRMIPSTAPWKSPGPALPGARSISGQVRPDPDVAAGTLKVRLAYDDLGDPKPPAGVAVTLVGYAADGKVSIVTRKTDASGIAELTGLDTSGHTSYFAFAVMSRGGTIDRLEANVFVLDRTAGARVMLSSFKRDSKEPPIDLLPATVPKDKVRVSVTGIPDPTAAIEVIDAATGKVLAKGTAPDSQLELAVKATPGQVLYAQTSARSETYRSKPIIAIAERGAALAVFAVPRVLHRFDLIATVEDDLLAVSIRFRIDNNAWLPVTSKIEVPLPAGFKDLVFRDGDEAYAKPTAKGFQLEGSLPPGGRVIILGFSLPIANTRAVVSLDLPEGTVDSSLRLKADPGVSFTELPTNVSVTRSDKHHVVEKITIGRNKSLRFAVIAPKPDPKQVAIRKACRELGPNRDSELIGKAMIDFTAPLLDGKPFKLSSLKGKLTFVTFNASFNSLRDDQKTLPAFAKSFGAELVTVLSDTDPAEVEKAFGKLPGRVVLDKPVNDASLGPITGTWNIRAVPETYVVDRGGTIRFHIVNQRDWSKPDTAACLRTGL